MYLKIAYRKHLNKRRIASLTRANDHQRHLAIVAVNTHLYGEQTRVYQVEVLDSSGFHCTTAFAYSAVGKLI